MKQLAPVEVEPQLPVRHHPQVALTHGGENRRYGDGVRREVLELDPIMEAEGPHEAARGREDFYNLFYYYYQNTRCDSPIDT